jgi:hypothetical protein
MIKTTVVQPMVITEAVYLDARRRRQCRMLKLLDGCAGNPRMTRRRRNQSFAEWAFWGLVRGVLALITAVVAAYLVYRVGTWAFTEAARQTIGN